LAVDDAMHFHSASALSHCDHDATVMGPCLVLGIRDRQHIVQKTANLWLSPPITPLPPRHEVLDLPVEKIEELDLLCIHAESASRFWFVAACPSGVAFLAHDESVSTVSGAWHTLERCGIL